MPSLWKPRCDRSDWHGVVGNRAIEQIGIDPYRVSRGRSSGSGMRVRVPSDAGAAAISSLLKAAAGALARFLSVEKMVSAEVDIQLHAQASLSVHGSSKFQPTSGAAATTSHGMVPDLS